MPRLTFVIFKVSEKIATLKFLPHTDTRPAGRPNTDHYIDSHFSCESKSINIKAKCEKKGTRSTKSLFKKKKRLEKRLISLYFIDISRVHSNYSKFDSS